MFRHVLGNVMGAALLLVLPSGCKERSSDSQNPGGSAQRFASVSKPADSAAVAKFCDLGTAAKEKDGARTYQAPPTRALAGAEPAPSSSPSGRWRWVNVWATWCTPCIAEMGLLSRWKDALARDGLPVDFELLSIDGPQDEDQLQKWTKKKLAGPISWIRSEEDFGPWMASLGADGAASIPIHVLVDPKGGVQCVRLGAVHEQDFGAVKALLNTKAG